MYLCMVKYSGMLRLLGIVSKRESQPLNITVESQITPIGLIIFLTPIYYFLFSDLLSLVAHLIFFAIPSKGKTIFGGKSSGVKSQN